MNKGDILELDIFDLNNVGAGVGRAEDGRVVFVRGCVGGDRARVEIIKINKSYAVASLSSLSCARLTAMKTAFAMHLPPAVAAFTGI